MLPSQHLNLAVPYFNFCCCRRYRQISLVLEPFAERYVHFSQKEDLNKQNKLVVE